MRRDGGRARFRIPRAGVLASAHRRRRSASRWEPPETDTASSPAPTPPTTTPRRGTAGLGTRVVQRLLNVWISRSGTRAVPLSEDGIFGPKTEAVLRLYQRAAALPTSGAIDRATWQRLVHTGLGSRPRAATAQEIDFTRLGRAFLCLTEAPHPADTAIKPLFDALVVSSVAVAQPIPVPAYYETKLLQYAAQSLADGLVLVAGYLRCPQYYRGGWILRLQPHAKAMTLDRTVFVDGNLGIGTYVHEMVHVCQYRTLGISGFLTSYFGIIPLTVIRRWLARQPINLMRANPHEDQAYGIESRFMAWLGVNP
jgi:putative peptidoglycan binding protein